MAEADDPPVTFFSAPPNSPFFFSFPLLVLVDGGKAPAPSCASARLCSSPAAAPIFSITFFITLACLHG